MRTYYNLFSNREEDIKVFNHATSIYIARAFNSFLEFAIFNNIIHLSLDINTIKLLVIL